MDDLPGKVEELRARLREIRERAGLSQGELARRIGLKRPSVSLIESGANDPSLETLIKWAAACGATLEIRPPDVLRSLAAASALSDQDLQLLADLAFALPSLPETRREDLAVLVSHWSRKGSNNP